MKFLWSDNQGNATEYPENRPAIAVEQEVGSRLTDFTYKSSVLVDPYEMPGQHPAQQQANSTTMRATAQ